MEYPRFMGDGGNGFNLIKSARRRSVPDRLARTATAKSSPFLARLFRAPVSQPRMQVGVVKGKRLVNSVYRRFTSRAARPSNRFPNLSME